MGCNEWKVWREKSSSARDELHAGLWREQVGERGRFRVEKEGRILLKRIWDLYRHILLDAGVGTGGAGGGRGWAWVGPGGELQVHPGGVSSRSYLCITARGRNLGLVCLKMSLGL